MLQEWHYFFQNTLRWRNLRKITIAQVHGAVYAAGPHADVGVRPDRRGRGHGASPTSSAPGSGMCGVEYFAHPWEFGAAQDEGAACSPATRSTPTRPTGSAW